MSDINEELLCVSWKDFRQNFEESLRDQVGDENISDVTLASEDGHQFPAQKAVLAASSQFLAEILKNDPALDLVFIGGVTSEVIKALLDFIYVGEVKMVEGCLQQFLAMLSELKLKGISENSLYIEQQRTGESAEDLLRKRPVQLNKVDRTHDNTSRPSGGENAKVDYGMKYSIPNRNTTDYSEWDDQILRVLERKTGFSCTFVLHVCKVLLL